MAELVATFPVGAFTDPQNGNSPIDADEVRANDDAMRSGFNAHDADSTIHFQGSVFASRPGAGTNGRKWFASDTKQIFRDNGSSWDEIDYLNKTNGGTVAGATTFTGTLTSTAGSRNFGATTFSGTVTGVAAIFSSTISAVGATLTAALTGTSASFSGSVSMNTGLVMASGAAIVWTNSSQQIVGNVGTGHVAYTATAHDFTGLITAAGGVQVTGGSSAAGELYKSGVSGLVVTGIAGSSSDLVLAGPGGANILTVPTGTVNVQFAGSIAISGQVITSDVASNSNGVDLTFHNGASLIATFSVTSGTSSFVGAVVASGSMQAGAGSAFVWNGRSRLNSPTDGNVTLLNNASSAFGLLQFGGTSSSFPAWKRSGTGIQARLADDSGFTSVSATTIGLTVSVDFSSITGTAKILGGTTGLSIRNNADSADNLLISDAGVITSRSNILSGASVIAAAGSGHSWNGRSQLTSPSDGVVTLLNNAGSSFSRLQLGGTTALFSAIKVASSFIEATKNAIIARTADDSAHAPAECSSLVVKYSDHASSSGLLWSSDGSVVQQVVGIRSTGWQSATGTATRTTFDTTTVTLPLLAQRVKALIDDLISHGLIGA